jgi:DNA invertase Pin-like site-specific DNA recombinase|tara:strand:- start:22 stop:609 length:588 start_codon:yes stop_codon:yes gene_type:complete
MRVAILMRCSTSHQTTENQRLELYEICERNDWVVVEEYDETISGTKGVNERDELRRMMTDASRKKFDKLVVWSIDRLGRNMKHLVSVLSQLKDLDIDIYSFKQGIDTSTTMGSSFFYMVGIFAELENNMRRERQIIGIKRALKDGVKFGRKDVVDEDTEFEIMKLRQQGKSYRKIAERVGISHTRVAQQCKSMSI